MPGGRPTVRLSDCYRYGHVNETALHHIPELRAMYAKALTAKWDYHLLVRKLLRDHIETQRHTNVNTALYLE